MAAARLLGHQRLYRRTPTADLLALAEWAARELEAAPSAALAAYYGGTLDALREEAERRQRRPTTALAAPARVTPALIARVKAAVPCPELIQHGGSVDLRPVPPHAPRHWVARCPLGTHRDTDPSFTVWADHFWCFGCAVGGDVIEWARIRARLEPHQFVEALRIVAAYAGISLDESPARDLRAALVNR